LIYGPRRIIGQWTHNKRICTKHKKTSTNMTRTSLEYSSVLIDVNLVPDETGTNFAWQTSQKSQSQIPAFDLAPVSGTCVMELNIVHLLVSVI